MSIELKQAAEKVLVVLGSATSFMSRKARDQHESVVAELRAAIQQAEAQQVENSTATTEPVAWLSTDSIGERYLCFTKPLDDPGAKPLVHPAPSVPDGLQWFTVAEHGLPEVGESVIGGLWYTDPWLKPDRATSFVWGQCQVVNTKHRDFKDGKQWLTFGPSHNQITHWARFNPPAILADKEK